MGYYNGGWSPYVSVAQRKAQAAKLAQKMAKAGERLSPVEVTGRTIASTFWGKAWCDNLESYSDYANRLPRGRTYVRNGSVIDLQIQPGRIKALVSGSEIYHVNITIKPLPKNQWQAICADCVGAIASLVELLQGRFSKGVMARVCQKGDGLFPSPKEIELDCSCPDWATMCKHVAAVLYGVGARLDEKPDLLFLLRGVDPSDLLSRGADVSVAAHQGANVLATDDLADLFGVEMATVDVPAASKPVKGERAVASPAKTAKTAKSTPVAVPAGGRKSATNKAVPVSKTPGKAPAKRASQPEKAPAPRPKATSKDKAKVAPSSTSKTSPKATSTRGASAPKAAPTGSKASAANVKTAPQDRPSSKAVKAGAKKAIPKSAAKSRKVAPKSVRKGIL